VVNRTYSIICEQAVCPMGKERRKEQKAGGPGIDVFGVGCTYSTVGQSRTLWGEEWVEENCGPSGIWGGHTSRGHS
jgi:hypothetical protein